MSVVLRCPNCGTTQRHPGECEACAEGEVRYFCTNHREGIWLEGPVCSRCGAKFGDPAKRPPPAPTPPIPTPAAGPPRFDRDDRPDPERLPPSLGELIEEITEARTRSRAPYEVEEMPWAEPAAPRIGFPLAGCLIRILSLGFLLFVAFVIFMFLLFGGLIGG